MSSGHARRPAQMTTAVIVDAALEIMSTQGLSALSIRSVAKQLGLSPMSVYRYVDSKESLLDHVVRRVLDRMEIPHAASLDWSERIVATMTAWHDLLIDNAEVVPLLVDRPVPLGSVGMARIADNVLANLEDAGIPSHEAVQAFWQIFILTLGHVVFELPRRHLRDEDMDGYAHSMAEIAEERGFARLRDLAPTLVAISGRGSFEDTLEVYLLGVHTRSYHRAQATRGVDDPSI